MTSKPRSMSNNEFWQRVLENEQERLSKDLETSTVAVDDILLGSTSDDDADDNIPIVSQLPKKLALLASLAEVPIPSAKQRKKKVPKSLWTYETVAEPTGAASRYWDADAPTERTTKRLAKERLVALREADISTQGQSSFFEPNGHHCVSLPLYLYVDVQQCQGLQSPPPGRTDPEPEASDDDSSNHGSPVQNKVKVPKKAQILGEQTIPSSTNKKRSSTNKPKCTGQLNKRAKQNKDGLRNKNVVQR
jgi:hypothetical protein